jgi:hypothetical protein
MSLTLSNIAVIKFYEEHPMLNFEKMNILFVEILNNLFSQISPNMDASFGLKVLNEITKIGKAINTGQNDNVKLLSLKLEEVKKQYIEDLEKILSNNNNNSIKPIIMEYTESLKLNTKNIIVENLNIHTNEVKRINVLATEKQDKIDEKLKEVLKKFESSSKKGNMSEMLTYNLLKTIYPETQLKMVNTIKESGDILLTRPAKPVILIENKDKEHVTQADVDKFIRDLSVQNCSGVFISQTSEIANKKSFEISFYGKNIGIYLGTVKYNTDLIQIAIDTIDTIKSKLVYYEDMDGYNSDANESSSSNQDISLTQEELDSLNKEYILFVNNKLKHIKTIREFSKKLIQETEDNNLSTLNFIIQQHYGCNKVTEWKCTMCNYIGKNKGSLSSHMKIHKKEIELN